MLTFFTCKSVIKAATIDSPTESLKTMCEWICYSYNTAVPTNTQEFMDTCYRDCAMQPKHNAEIGAYSHDTDQECYMVGGTESLTADTIMCYGNRLCSNYGRSVTKWCQSHKGGSKAKSDYEIEQEATERRNNKREQCRAAYITVYSDGSPELETAINSCMEGVVGLCNSEASCRTVLCQKDEFKNSDYCQSGKSAKDYISSSTSGGTKGSLAEDLIDPSVYNETNCYGFSEIVYYATLIITMIRIVAPIILIVWASIDLLKSIIAGDEKKIIEMRKPIIQRFIAAAAIYLVPWIVRTIVFNLTTDVGWVTCWQKNRYTIGYNNPINNSNKVVINDQYTVEID